MNSNSPSSAIQRQLPVANGMRPQQEQHLASGQLNQGFPSGARNFRPRPNQPRYGVSAQESNLSRSTTRTSEGELAPVNQAALDGLRNFHKEEQTIRNDLAIRYTVSGEWGGNHIKGASPEDTCKEYPKLRRLMELKQDQVFELAHPPLHMTFDPIDEPLMSLTKHLPIPFDVILIDPPPSYDWAKITSIPIRLISADPSFVFLWVGDAAGEGLERGREALLKWGFRRCEEILWIKPNKNAIRAKKAHLQGGEGAEGSDVARWMQQGRKDTDDQPKNVMITQKEHCLMGIRGTVRRKTDNWFVHCNVDTDIMVWERDEEDENASRFPPQLYTIIENFCLGTRRLELFGPKSRAREGWVTLGEDDLVVRGNDVASSHSVQEYTPEKYSAILQATADQNGRHVLPQVEEIEAIRPKSPTRGERPGSSYPASGQSTPLVYSGPGVNPNRPHPPNSGHRQGSFRPPRFPTQAPAANWNNSRDDARPGMPNPQWRPMPPRMYPSRTQTNPPAFVPAIPLFDMSQMRAEVGRMENGFMNLSMNDSAREVSVPPQMYGTQDTYPPYVNHLYPPPPPQPYPQPQQYMAECNPNPNRTDTQTLNQPFLRRFAANNQQPRYMEQHSRTNQPSFADQQAYMNHPAYANQKQQMDSQHPGSSEVYSGYPNGQFFDESHVGQYHSRDSTYRNPALGQGNYSPAYHPQQ
ncbi:hypothetical protein QFC21_003765 [Naganishia friedmannii]|uniref:Uncharacterized protein n=1 Tax=Naganishia friedmannii TaxID=89922 RepID=A0ACC2VMJ7_9TREE|nr:hypothetical protein QFC21_003765 [Naganishia friedmannii]